MDWAGKQLKIKERKDWYEVTAKVTDIVFFSS
jgi:hypothetical protein